MRELAASQLFMLTLTIGVYLAGVALYRLTKIRLLHPLLTSVALIITFLKITGIEYPEYKSATQLIDFMLGVCVVSLGYLLYEQLERIKSSWITVLTAISVGSVVGIVSVVLIAHWMGVPEQVVVSLQPKSVTMPIAVAVSANSGGVPAITSLVVVVVGLFGAMVAPFVMDRLGITDRIARGLALGSASHAIGTTRAIELGAVEGAFSGMAMGIMGFFTALFVPLLEKII